MSFACRLSAQCPAVNKAFKSGEELEYTLYFNWSFIWIKCGSATFSTRAAYYKGQDAYRCDLLFRTNEKFDHYFSNDVFRNEVTKNECMYDMMSMMALARSFNGNTYKKGDHLYFDMTSSDEVCRQTMIYRGKENFKANDGVTYRCLVFSMLDWEEKKKEKEILRFYFSDDENHLPLRIDFKLKFGTAKAFYTGGKNIRNPMNSIVKK